MVSWEYQWALERFCQFKILSLEAIQEDLIRLFVEVDIFFEAITVMESHLCNI